MTWGKRFYIETSILARRRSDGSVASIKKTSILAKRRPAVSLVRLPTVDRRSKMTEDNGSCLYQNLPIPKFTHSRTWRPKTCNDKSVLILKFALK